MPRALTTLDAFNAIAERKRRNVLEALAAGERSVNELVTLLQWPQPQVSKHLGVLKKVGLVHDRKEGRRRMYGLNALPIRDIHSWTSEFERYWDHQLAAIKDRAERRAKQ